MDSALVVTWTTPFPGRERMALDYAAEVDEHWRGLAAQGLCSEPEMFFFPDGHGMWLVKGEPDAMLTLFLTERSQHLVTKGQLLLDDFSYELVRTGDAARAYLLEYAGLGQQLGVI